MKTKSSARPFGAFKLTTSLFAAAALWLLVAFAASAAPLSIEFRSASDGAVITVPDYRWTVEEDATKASIPGLPASTSNYSFSFHTSYMPVLAAGRVGTQKTGVTADPDVNRLYAQPLPEVCTSAPTSVCLNPAKRYYLSIAADGYQMAGAPIVFGPSGTASAVVYINKYPLPTAQVSVFVFDDNNPINGAPDLPQEMGLAGFHVRLIEAGGTYGMSGGEVTQDAFANPLGTTYKRDTAGNPVTDADGNPVVDVKGSGIILTDANGVALIKNLYPAKYTILVVPPNGSDWHQTSTIEGTKGIDAWVKNNEPSFFQEFGPPGHHVFIGFTRSGSVARNADNSPVVPAASGGGPVSGRIVNTHYSRPPVYTFFKGAPVDNCWVGLNEPNGGRALYAVACDKQSKFTIPGVPAGTYELVVWDEPLDMIIAATTITVPAGGTALGDLPVSSWFGRYQGRVFQDIDGTGSPKFEADFTGKYIRVEPATGAEREVDCTPGSPDAAVRTLCPKAGDLKPPFGSGIASNIRFRDGSIYQSVATKDDGTFGFTEVFPFFNWMIAEIDYARFKATGATTVVDGGGEINASANKSKLWDAPKGLFGSVEPAFAYDPWVRLNPQCQDPPNCTKYYSTDQGVALLYGMQTFLGQTNHIEWGKQPYGMNQNGGIAGIVQYAITRAEDDPRYAAAEPWEPGIPRVQMNLFLDCDGDGKPDKPAPFNASAPSVAQCTDLSGNGYAYDPPDVDNYPFGWSSGGAMGPEDQCRSNACKAATTSPKPFSNGDVFVWGSGDSEQVGIGTTDSWDDKLPGGCPDPTPYVIPGTNTRLDCFDGLRNFNQLRPAVFDGGYGFGSVAGQPDLPIYIGAEGKGTYIVEAVAPPGYLHQGNGDKNVVFGDVLRPATAALPHECVGAELDVPEFLTLFPGEPNPNFGSPQYPNNKWRKCDMKAVPLNQGQNAAPNFFMFTEAPVAGHGVGFILDDTSTEFNHFAPTFGEKYSPPHLPVSIQDWTGREISRVYSDQFGSYNFLVPSTFTINPPYPSGVMPSMMVACMNHPGPIADPNDPTKQIIDPFFNRNYSQFCYTLQYLPGKTTYLDTPVLPISAFASVSKNPLDCECENGTPEIYGASNADNGPWVPSSGGTLTIVSQGTKDVVNPYYDPTLVVGQTDPADPTKTIAAGDTRLSKTIPRDYGFGATQGTIRLGSTTLAVVGNSWTNDGVQVAVPANTPTGQQLTIVRGDNGKESVVGLTVHVGGNTPKKVNPNAAAGCVGDVCRTIQDAIDASVAGDLITIGPGAYKEYVILDKRVRLQGWGAGSVTIDAGKSATTGLAAWRTKINARAGNTFSLLPGQTLGIDPANNEPLLFGAEEGPGVLVVGKMLGAGTTSADPTRCADSSDNLRVDGLTITSADAGGGILASGYACGLKVTNNRVVANYGTYGGGIRIGHTVLLAGDNTFTDAVNRGVSIHHNWVAQNGATEAGGGGGITLGTGSDNYVVARNYVCGNFSMADGGGLSHIGRSGGSISSSTSPANLISGNQFLFNQTFNQSADPMGGGVSIAGQIPVGGGTSPGTGDVRVDANLIQSNQAGAGAGGGVSIAHTTPSLQGGLDVVLLTNNMIVNNVAAYAGGGVSLTDVTLGVELVNNTIASNVSTATNRQSWGVGGPVKDANGNVQPSQPQIAGVALLDGTSPIMLNNIFWANRSYIYLIDGTTTGLFNPGTTNVNSPAAGAVYSDLGRVGSTDLGTFMPRYSVFTDTPANQATFNVGTSSCTGSTSLLLNPVCNKFALPDDPALFVKWNDFLSITDPDQPVQLADATVNLQSALTFDETGNFINVIFSPLTRWNGNGSQRADYHITATSIARDAGRNQGGIGGVLIGANFVPSTDIDSEPRAATLVDIGADEVSPPPADLAITNTNGVSTVGQGASVSYTVVVSNAGPNPVTGATVTDNVPLSDVTWTCTATQGSSCPGNGSGNVNALVDLANGGSATFVINGTVGALAQGTLVNTASVAPPADRTDPNAANNTATDSDAIVVVQPSLGVLDNFNRANANNLGSSWSQAGTGTGVDIRLVSNQAFVNQTNDGAQAIWNPTSFGTSQGAAFTLTAATAGNRDESALILKANGGTTVAPANFIRVRYDTFGANHVTVETTTNGGSSFVSRATLNVNIGLGQVLMATVDTAGVVRVWVDGTYLGGVQLPTTGANSWTMGGGRIGMKFGGTNRTVDDFKGATLP